MDRATKSEQILEKCLAAGCNEKAKKRHHEAYVFGRWDVHPPEDFRTWHEKNGQGGNVITAWNSDSDRQEFYKSRGQVAQEKEELPF